MGKFWRSLNLKLVLFVYLMILQTIVYLDRYTHVITKFPFMVEERVVENSKEYVATIKFYGPRYEKAAFLLDAFRTFFLVSIFFYPKSAWFTVFAFLLFVSFRIDFSWAGLVFPNHSELIYNLKYNTLFRLSIINELVIRLAVVYLWFQRRKMITLNQNARFNWDFSLGDLSVFILLLAATIAIFR